MEKNKNTLSQKRLKIGGYGVVLVIAVIAVVVLLNVVVNLLPANYTHFNMDTVDFFDLGNDTAKVLGGIKEDVNVYYVVPKGSEDPMVEEMLLRYKAESSNIKVKNIDPAVYPFFMDKYSESELGDEGCLVFETSKRFRVITADDIYYRDMSNVSDQDKLWAYLYGIDVGTNYFLGELAFTTAIDYVTRETISTVYFLTGHGESELDSYFTELIDDENIVINTLDIQKTNKIPEDCSALISVLPTADYTDGTTELLTSYLKEGGDFILVTDSRTYHSSAVRPNIAKVAKAAGLESIDGTVTDKYMGELSKSFTPSVVESPTKITSLLESLTSNSFFSNAHGIKEIEGGDKTAVITPLVRTSDKGKINVTDDDGKTSVPDEYKDGKVIYPAVQSDRNVENGKYGDSSCFVWFANASMTDPNYVSSYSNDELFLAAISYVCENDISLSILGKTSEIEPLTVPATHADVMMLVFTVVLPLAVLGTGFAFWFRRRKL